MSDYHDLKVLPEPFPMYTPTNAHQHAVAWRTYVASLALLNERISGHLISRRAAAGRQMHEQDWERSIQMLIRSGAIEHYGKYELLVPAKTAFYLINEQRKADFIIANMGRLKV